MATTINEKPYSVSDFSGAVQRRPSKFMKKANEVDLSVNLTYQRIGGVEKMKGYDRIGNTITTVSTSSSTSTSTSTSTSSSTSTSTSTSSTTTP